MSYARAPTDNAGLTGWKGQHHAIGRRARSNPPDGIDFSWAATNAALTLRVNAVGDDRGEPRTGPQRRPTIRDHSHKNAEAGLAPGVVFGPGGDGCVRISMAVESPVIREGLSRIAGALRSLA